MNCGDLRDKGGNDSELHGGGDKRKVVIVGQELIGVFFSDGDEGGEFEFCAGLPAKPPYGSRGRA